MTPSREVKNGINIILFRRLVSFCNLSPSPPHSGPADALFCQLCNLIGKATVSQSSVSP